MILIVKNGLLSLSVLFLNRITMSKNPRYESNCIAAEIRDFLGQHPQAASSDCSSSMLGLLSDDFARKMWEELRYGFFVPEPESLALLAHCLEVNPRSRVSLVYQFTLDVVERACGQVEDIVAYSHYLGWLSMCDKPEEPFFSPSEMRLPLLKAAVKDPVVRQRAQAFLDRGAGQIYGGRLGSLGPIE